DEGVDEENITRQTRDTASPRRSAAETGANGVQNSSQMTNAAPTSDATSRGRRSLGASESGEKRSPGRVRPSIDGTLSRQRGHVTISARTVVGQASPRGLW